MSCDNTAYLFIAIGAAQSLKPNQILQRIRGYPKFVKLRLWSSRKDVIKNKKSYSASAREGPKRVNGRTCLGVYFRTRTPI